MNIGLYIHIPFCQQKCMYCDFPSYTGLSHLYSDYTAALCREISGWGGILSDMQVDTLYIGGGTPTLLPTVQLERILQCVRDNFSLAENGEYSIEANPGTVDEEKLVRLRRCGLNRLSFGVQSFSNELLKGLGRIHSPEDAVQALTMGKKAGFKNLSLDLMYGLPNQSLEQLKESVDRACQLEVEHISIYGLKVEEGTPFFSRQQDGHLMLPEEETEEAMYDFITSDLPARGFFRYEISNYAKNGKACLHNLKYWQFQPYIGIGAAAHSFWKEERFANTADVSQYIERVFDKRSPVEFREKLETRSAKAEFAFLALRTAQGICLEAFQEIFKEDFMDCYGATIAELIRKQLVVSEDKRIFLTPLGMKYGNIVFSAFLPD